MTRLLSTFTNGAPSLRIAYGFLNAMKAIFDVRKLNRNVSGEHWEAEGAYRATKEIQDSLKPANTLGTVWKCSPFTGPFLPHLFLGLRSLMAHSPPEILSIKA